MEASSWLDSLTESSTKHFSLEAPTSLMKALGNPQNKIKTIHVAGTNGKGSTCCFIASLLDGVGYKVGQFLSPHLTRVEERCLIDGMPVDSSVFFDSLEEVQNTGLPVSFFEAVFAASCLVFVKESCSFAVIETGLGGRLDATNTIESPEATVVTSIGFDHQDLLGKTLDKIAWEKANIAKPNVKMFVGSENGVVRQVCKEKSARYIEPEHYENSLSGYQKQNGNLALQVVESVLGELPDQYMSLLSRVSWPGRLEEFEDGRVLIDGAHNVNAVKEFLEVVDDRALVFACLEHKDWVEMGGLFKDREVFYCDFSHPKALRAEEFCAYFARAKKVSSVLELSEKRIACFGSLYFIGEVRPLFTDKFEVFQSISKGLVKSK